MTTHVFKALAIAIMICPAAAMAKSNVVKQCLDHTHRGFAVQQKGMTKGATTMAALQDWKATVTAHDGASWAHIPRDAPVTCVQMPPNAPNQHWECTVVYRPCRLVPSDLPAASPMPGLQAAPGN